MGPSGWVSVGKGRAGEQVSSAPPRRRQVQALAMWPLVRGIGVWARVSFEKTEVKTH